ncbi:arsenate-mycothiol transferase ArsC [Costertonia aggregata]|uniref:Protein-tyrosine-phosphatase n=1 Tax=Costertonia aggregata TaxID=343403 RepID=A0A7H9AN63_9FLAO|nr:protein-tyrosine-phosphatase [Costertonia aggregata]QLG44867.1 protein-tyrosine-phosphatase [Costertonia aggregata]
MENEKPQVFPEIETTIQSLNIKDIATDRKKTLQPLVEFLQTKILNKSHIDLNFICTHNSRRSHLSQVWGQTLAFYTGIKNISCYSGGTEATALFPVAAETLKNLGFKIRKLSEEKNPVYSIKYAKNVHPIIGFSKTYDDDFNPKSGFGAIMTCSQADEGCPFVAGAEKRFPITYEDPKAFDNTPYQAKKYEERCLQIATELYYVFTKAMA